jgi:ankyrin repeat protein
VCALLLDYGADAAHRDSTSRTPLHYARDKKLDYVVALLSCHGNAMADFVKASRYSNGTVNRADFHVKKLPPLEPKELQNKGKEDGRGGKEREERVGER